MNNKQHVLITGHTGFKGSWLTLMLIELGYKVSGIGLDPIVIKSKTNGKTEQGIFNLANISDQIVKSGGKDIRLDIRNRQKLTETVCELQPDIVIHLAAQPLVKESYADPATTFETNIMGTYYLLEATQTSNEKHAIKAQLIITTDKVYKNYNKVEGYKEDEELGMNPDPYSSSKTCADIVTQCMINHPKYTVPTCIARGGNVIGGGDRSPDRLLVDLIRNLQNDEPTYLRYPDATRPWQHVLDCLSGYIAIINAMINEKEGVISESFNISPKESDLVDVGTVASKTIEFWGDGAKMWQLDQQKHPHEAGILSLDNQKTKKILGWEGKFNYQEAIEWTVSWEKAALNEDLYQKTILQIKEYFSLDENR